MIGRCNTCGEIFQDKELTVVPKEVGFDLICNSCKTSKPKTYKAEITKPFNNFIKNNEKLLRKLSK